MILQLEGQEVEIGDTEINRHLTEVEDRVCLEVLKLLPPVRLHTHMIEHELIKQVNRDGDLHELKILGYLLRSEFRSMRNADEDIIFGNADHLTLIENINMTGQAQEGCSHILCTCLATEFKASISLVKKTNSVESVIVIYVVL